jgi:hypothetical protein
MTEPVRMVSPQPQSGMPGLWKEAPGWRNLTIAAMLLSVSAVALPLSLPEAPASLKTEAPAQVGQQPDVCRLSMSPTPGPPIRGTVLSFVDRATSMAQIRMIEAQAGGLIDPAYIDRQRVSARLDDGKSYFFFVPPKLQVHVGDRVVAQAWYRNEHLPCNYVPNAILDNLGPAAGTGENLPR